MNKETEKATSSFSTLWTTMKSITITLTGNSSTLTSYFHPEIELDGSYSCCLLDFSASDYLIVTKDNNTLHYQVVVKMWPDQYGIIEIPIGVYKERHGIRTNWHLEWIWNASSYTYAIKPHLYIQNKLKE